ncbi:MAG: Holliday junction branch migration DNA helicase RuvB [Bdellovibrionota bacterium]
MSERIVSSETLGASLGETKFEISLRPKSLGEFPGQKNVTDKLKVFVEAAMKRKEPLDHTLFYGPPGLGKTTLAYILGETLGVDVKTTSGPALDKKGDLAAILTSLQPNSILFIDEIHRLNRNVEEYLYSAMEDFYIDMVTGEGLGARSMKFQLAPFTLVGATTRIGLLDNPFRDRFGIIERLNFYNENDLVQILTRSAGLLNTEIVKEGTLEIARRARGTPRVANRLLRRVRDYAQIQNNGVIDEKIAKYALDQMEVDHRGLDEMDRRLLILMIEKFQGGPVGLDTLSAALNEERETIEEVYEPYLIQQGFLQKTPRGRVASPSAYEHLGLKAPKTLAQPNVQLDI